MQKERVEGNKGTARVMRVVYPKKRNKFKKKCKQKKREQEIYTVVWLSKRVKSMSKGSLKVTCSCWAPVCVCGRVAFWIVLLLSGCCCCCGEDDCEDGDNITFWVGIYKNRRYKESVKNQNKIRDARWGECWQPFSDIWATSWTLVFFLIKGFQRFILALFQSHLYLPVW